MAESSVADSLAAVGAPCGATRIDRYFLEEFLPYSLGPAEHEKLLNYGGGGATSRGGSHEILKPGEQFMLERFQTIKHGFVGRDDSNQQPASDFIDLPGGVGEHDDTERISNGQLAISWSVSPYRLCSSFCPVTDGWTRSSDDLEQMFRESVDGTLELILQQLGQLEGRHLVQVRSDHLASTERLGADEGNPEIGHLPLRRVLPQ